MEKIMKEVIGGKVVYRDQMGKKIEAYDTDLPSLASFALSPLRDFLDMPIENEDPEKTINIARALLERAEERIDATTKFIWDNLGEIWLGRACIKQSVESETMLGVTFKPCEGVKP